MEIKKVYPLLLPVLFVLLLVFPFINNSLNLFDFQRKVENRLFTDSITVDLSRLDDLPIDCNNYINDNFSFRTPLLNIYHSTKFHILKSSPHPDKVLMGNNNWFFNSGKEQRIYEGYETFSKFQLDSFSQEWKHRIQYLDSLHIKPYWIVSPIKHHVYSEQLPFSTNKIRGNRTNLLLKELSKEFPELIINPVEILNKRADSAKLFFQLDNHWNFQAGELVGKQFLNRIRKDFPLADLGKTDDVNWIDSTTNSGNHANDIGVSGLSEKNYYPHIEFESIETDTYQFKGIEGFAYGYAYEHTYENKQLQKKGLRILIIRDSFGNQMLPFMRDHFAESVWIFDAWKYQLNEEIILQVKPDIILFQSLETHIESIIR